MSSLQVGTNTVSDELRSLGGIVPNMPLNHIISTCSGVPLAITVDIGTQNVVVGALVPGAKNQLWQFVYFPSQNAVALLVEMQSEVYSLCSFAGESYPALAAFQFDASHLWRVPPIQTQNAIACIRDIGNTPLTIPGDGPWLPGGRVECVTWNDQANQQWSFIQEPA